MPNSTFGEEFNAAINPTNPTKTEQFDTAIATSAAKWALLSGIRRQYLIDDYYLTSDANNYAPALVRAVTAAGGRPVYFEPEKAYNFATSANVGLRNYHLIGRGSRVIGPASAQILGTFQTKRNYPSGSDTTPVGGYFNTVAGDNSILTPTGVLFNVGEFVKFESDTVRVVAGNYLHGEWNEVMAVIGPRTYFRDPFMNSYQVDRIRVRGNDYQYIEDLIIDATATTAQTANTVQNPIVLMNARDVYADVRIFGNEFCSQGVLAEGYQVAIGGYGSEITNMLGMNDGSGTARTGYAFSASGRRIRYFGEAVNCKHGFTSGPRSGLVEFVHFDNVKGSTPKGESALMSTHGDSTKWQAIVDCHANVANALVENATLRGVNSLIMHRCDRMEVRGGDLFSYGTDYTFGQDGLIYMGEHDNQLLVVDGTRARASRTTAGAAIPSLVMLYGVFGNQKFNFEVRNVEGDNLRMGFMRTTGSAAATTTIGRGSFKNMSGEWSAGPQLGGPSAVNPSGSLGTLEFDFTNVKIDTPNYARRPGLLVQHFASFDKIITRGYCDARLMTNGFDAIQIGYDDTVTSGNVTPTICAGIHGDIDWGMSVEAYRHGLRIGTTGAAGGSFTPRMGTTIGFNHSGGTGGVAIFSNFSNFAPAKKWTYMGLKTENRGGAGALAFTQSGLRNDDISGLTTNCSLPAFSGTAFYQPVGVRMVGFTEQIIRASSPNIYLNHLGQLTADSAPTIGVPNGIPAGTLIYARTPAPGAPMGWELTGGATWRVMGILEEGRVQTKTAAYTLVQNDNTSYFLVDSATDVNITIPNSLIAGWSAAFKQVGVGRINFVAASGATLDNEDGHTKTSRTKALVTLFVDSNVGGTSALVTLAGSTDV